MWHFQPHIDFDTGSRRRAYGIVESTWHLQRAVDLTEQYYLTWLEQIYQLLWYVPAGRSHCYMVGGQGSEQGQTIE
ncbi:MAG: hypothetical protein DHS20C11_24780 [Lysobacteraceae bacterium]|nr:MAG: hypothetical protein DHS20C11_24780 [Xanthomonadaceae bacterium]